MQAGSRVGSWPLDLVLVLLWRICLGDFLVQIEVVFALWQETIRIRNWLQTLQSLQLIVGLFPEARDPNPPKPFLRCLFG